MAYFYLNCCQNLGFGGVYSVWGAIVIIFLEHNRNTFFNVTHFQVQLVICQGFLQDYWSLAALECKNGVLGGLGRPGTAHFNDREN